MMSTNETWKKVDINNNYSVSDLGRVRNDNTNRILKQFSNTFGYSQIELGNKQVLVSRLVGAAFIPNDDPIHKTQINHKDEDKKNNRVDNLEWCTAGYNMNYGTRSKRAAQKHEKKVVAIDKNNLVVGDFHSLKTASIVTGVSVQSISSYCRGRLGWTRSGITFRYSA